MELSTWRSSQQSVKLYSGMRLASPTSQYLLMYIYITVVFHNIFKIGNFSNPVTINGINCFYHSVVLMKFPFIIKLNRLIA